MDPSQTRKIDTKQVRKAVSKRGRLPSESPPALPSDTPPSPSAPYEGEESATDGDAPASVQINATGLSDTPSAQDAIGFAPYVRALAWFLSSEKTQPPLTISIEGPWGSGKSSFMLQLNDELKEIAKNRKGRATGRVIHKQKRIPGSSDRQTAEFFCVKFNAWRSDKDEALWAGFALTFMRELERNVPWHKRVRANIKLLWHRFDWKRGKWQIAQFAVFWISVIVLTIAAVFCREILQPTIHPINSGLFGTVWFAAVVFAFKKCKSVLGNPLSIDLGRYVKNPRYEEKIAFIERFQEDFSQIISSYIGKSGRLFVFIDDLDRCEVPHAADLMQAINLLLSTEQANLFFILGLDREMVAAGLAAKYEKILPYLAAGRAFPGAKPPDNSKVGIEYGYAFLEKFIQVPFRVPTADESRVEDWVAKIMSTQAASSSSAQFEHEEAQRNFKITLGEDPEELDSVVIQLAGIFEFNPRRLKQFVNVFRLRVMIAVMTNVLAPGVSSGRADARPNGITLKQLGLFTAIILRWPGLIGDLIEDPQLLARLASNEGETNGTGDRKSSGWENEEKLVEAVSLGGAYSLAGTDLRPLLIIMPDTFRGAS